MVIQQNMPVSGIVAAWLETEVVIRRYGIPANSNKALQEHVSGEILQNVLNDLNQSIGSSEMTCVEGG
jgi:hypothetical protein